MKMQFESPADFEEFKESLRKRLRERPRRSISYPDYRKAAVLILFFEKEKSPHVIMTLRTERVSTHKGQVSFPGGGFDSTDRDFLNTALRETHEEVGIEPSAVEVIGEFDEYISIMGFHVYVFAGALNSKPEYRPCTDETEQVLEVPLSMFINEEYERCEKLEHEGREFDVYYYNFNGITIWGMTARIMTDFSRKICRLAQD